MGKGSKRGEKKRPSPKRDETTKGAGDERCEKGRVAPLPREEWMTKPKEGWLADAPRPEKGAQKSSEATKKPIDHGPGLYDPKGSGTGNGGGRSAVGDGGASWRWRALQRMRERGQAEGKPLEEIAAERGIDLAKLKREAVPPPRRPNRLRLPPDRPYLDDVRTPQGWMLKPEAEKSSFARRRREREATAEKDDPESFNKFANDGSFFSMFSNQGEEDPGKNSSIAARLRQQLTTGTSAKALVPASTPRERPVHPNVAEMASLSKRSRRDDDIDRALVENITKQRRFDFREDMNPDNEYDYGVGTDLFGRKSKKNRSLTLSELQQKEKRRILKAHRHKQSLQDRCRYCFDGTTIPKHLVVALGTAAYLRLPQSGALDPLHCCIVPLEHVPTTREADEAAWTEIRNFKKALIQMHHSQGRDVVFLETALHLSDRGRHAVVECIPVEERVLEQAPVYYKKAIDDATADWSQHHAKRCIETGKKGLRGSIPEHFPYFHVEFNLTHGFVHVIDDEDGFDPNLGRRVLIGLLDRPAEDMFRREATASFEDQKAAVHRFLQLWRPYDWTLGL